MNQMNSKLGTTENKIGELRYITTETTQNGGQKRKRL